MRRRTTVSQAPMALGSDGVVLVNAAQLTTASSLAAVIEVAERSGLGVFVGVVVPRRRRCWVLRNLDDALADVVGRLGPRLVSARVREAK